LIPGEFVRRGRASAGPLDGTNTPVTDHPADAGISDRERLEYEREGGGAPGERSGGGSRAFLRRFWRSV
jgi:hypothetical protein